MARTLLMTDLIPAGLPPWLAPLLIVSVAMAFVLLLPALRAFSKAGASPVQAFWLLIPVAGLVIVAVLMMGKVMPAAGKPRLLALLVIVPLVNVMFLWLFAFGAWSEGAPAGAERRKDRRSARRREAKTGEEARETPTLSGNFDQGSSAAARETPAGAGARGAGLAEPTLQADAGPALGAAASAADGAAGPSLSSAKETGHAAGVGDMEAGVTHEDTAVDAADTGDQTIVAGALSKGRTKVVARTDDDPADRKEAKTQRPGASVLDQYDLVGVGDQDMVDQAAPGQNASSDDAYDEDGEPIERAAGRDDDAGDRAGEASFDKDHTDAALASAAAAAGDGLADDGDDGDDGGKVPAAVAKNISEEDMTLAEGVLDDLQQAAMDPTESPVVTALPLTDGVQDRVWLVQGVNARAANIEASIREEDISRSVTGILVGRSNRADFIIDDESVSRNHARFVYLDGTLHVEDLDSMNGTWVDGEKLVANDQQPLRRASDVEFGKIRLEVKEVDPT